jgi:hypothetical protein
MRMMHAAAAGFAALFLSTAVFAQDIEYTLINSSSSTVMEFYTSPVDVAEWEEDILGANVLPAGTMGTVTIADGRSQCDYDLMFIFEDGSELIDTVNICDLASYEITD